MELTILGMNGPYPAANGACSGYFVTAGDTRLQLDLGSGTLGRLTALTAPERLTALVFSHWHFDHAGDILPLIYRLADAAVRGCSPLPVYGPADDSSPLRQAAAACPAIELHTLQPGDQVVLGDVTLAAAQARHPVPALMYRLTDAAGKTIVFTGDTNTVPHLTDFCRGADLLLADGLFTEALWAEGKPHLSAVHCARLANEAGVGRLVITHLHPDIPAAQLQQEAWAVRRDVTMAKPGLTVEL